MLDLQQIVTDIANGLLALDRSRKPFRQFQPGVGPYGEPQVMRIVAEFLKLAPVYGLVKTKRSPDLLIPGQWAIEVKLARPFGDNGVQAENWSVNLLHPDPGNISLIGDCLKLALLGTPEKKAVVVIGYEHSPPVISLKPLLQAFEVLSREVMQIELGPRSEVLRTGLCHPVHQQVLVVGWEVLTANPQKNS